MHGRIAALVIEDMDIDLDDGSSKRWSNLVKQYQFDLEARRQCGRQFSSFEELSNKLSRWYGKERIQGWRDDGRVFEKHDGTWWSGVSPLAQVCCAKYRAYKVGMCLVYLLFCTLSPSLDSHIITLYLL